MSKELYESLDTVYLALHRSTVSGDELAAVVAGLAGLVWEDGTHERDGAYVLNPDAATEGRKVAHRWLRDHGYTPR